ncbi:hypothetical protein [Pseudomonas sp. AE27]|jgi:hypothetical protein|uniref:hypothetical protein n=1 Tax=Pseudomonas sp. AE27 TaxID=3127460 RepID=UPI001E2E93CC
MINQDMFKPSISLWQHYVTILAVGGMGFAMSLDSGWIALIVVVTFFGGAAVEGYVDARGAGRG